MFVEQPFLNDQPVDDANIPKERVDKSPKVTVFTKRLQSRVDDSANRAVTPSIASLPVVRDSCAIDQPSALSNIPTDDGRLTVTSTLPVCGFEEVDHSADQHLTARLTPESCEAIPMRSFDHHQTSSTFPSTSDICSVGSTIDCTNADAAHILELPHQSATFSPLASGE